MKKTLRDYLKGEGIGPLSGIEGAPSSAQESFDLKTNYSLGKAIARTLAENSSNGERDSMKDVSFNIKCAVRDYTFQTKTSSVVISLAQLLPGNPIFAFKREMN